MIIWTSFYSCVQFRCILIAYITLFSSNNSNLIERDLSSSFHYINVNQVEEREDQEL